MADIARLTGTSMSTVSRVMAGSPLVAAATQARVLAEAERLGYVVSPAASGLARGVTGRVAVVVPHIARWFFATLLEGVESVLRDGGLDVLLYHVGDAADRAQLLKGLPLRGNVDAIVLFAMPIDEAEREHLESLGVDLVAAGGQVESYPYVAIDDRAAARQAVDHLLQLGHHRIAMISATDPDQPGWPAPFGRAEGYYTALRDAGLPVEEDLVVTVPWGETQGAVAMERLLQASRPPTAVYAHSDELALGALRTLRRAGLRVPDDVSVIGIDDHPLSQLTDLTTIAQPVREQGVTAGRMVRALLRGEPTDRGVLLPTELIIRGTTAPSRSA